STTSSATSEPACIVAATAGLTELPDCARSRSISPVEICGIFRQADRSFACVPLPEPGEPKRTIARGIDSYQLSALSRQLSFLSSRSSRIQYDGAAAAMERFCLS